MGWLLIFFGLLLASAALSWVSIDTYGFREVLKGFIVFWSLVFCVFLVGLGALLLFGTPW